MKEPHVSEVRIVFVCLGNICRSPTAEGIMRKLLADEKLDGKVEIDSAGTGSWHVGEPPDPRAADEAERRGFRLGGRARQVKPKDFDRFDYVVAMDASNRKNLEKLAPNAEARRKIHMLRDFETGAGGAGDVPDPYYGGGDGFQKVFDICERSCRGLIEHLRREHGL
ncbi:MAG: low molecular weight protein-tyrosine-phosphatase [Polyangiales bacterium]